MFRGRAAIGAAFVAISTVHARGGPSCFDAVAAAERADGSSPKAWIWDATSRQYAIREITLPDLPDANRLDGTYFRIVRDDSDVPLSVSEAGFAGSNVYYHLSFARERMLALGASLAHLKFPVTVRIGVTHDYDRFTKFAGREAYNNARTINGWFDTAADAWTGGDEIWFHEPRHKKKKFRPWLICLFDKLQYSPVCATEVRFASAYAPDVIYHEFAHLVSCPHLGRNQTSFLSEGFSNYLAAAVENDAVVGNVGWSCVPLAGRYDLAHQTHLKLEKGGYGKATAKSRIAVPSLLWSVRTALPDGVGDRLALAALSSFNKSSPVTDLPAALLGACDGGAVEQTLVGRCKDLVTRASQKAGLTPRSSRAR